MAKQAKGKWNTFNLEIITPERVVVDEEVEGVSLPSTDGLLGILRNHAPFIGALDIGIIKYLKEGSHHYIACSMGIFEMKGNMLRILPDTAELGERIDVDRAKKARERAARRIQQKAQELDYLRAEMALKRSLARLKAAEAAGMK
ncbi:F0F1 ATP synthase subunit epsilon [Syntrophaceticus schinkii]|uniref:ATP synthase epsilon chain n=1 Tax=Syntrophaceticus schinkii TaxID=499207 RepID=A0A0B7ML48_9FIRM|nr:F0F1 ATP synthase subunit epsilon [Syntrophaceticus schinkii]MDD2358888.1 F0F1 ATP synthase subunit epsilon [Syntrophaceticus schinkii]MDD4260948.1 F0F1 ATP synthase subunit epsilon [Syntrophaceticus schinkii]MDD4674076.1 F0F1 ATP synthase subunit epsilon [Syntrophaceticus schinkii]CEO88681.1 ATP synthase epsilon chain [Syntrophaceticus schinkii]